MDEGLDPQVKLKLLEAERAAEPDYPNIKRGIGCGIAALFIAGICALFAVSFFRSLTTSAQISMVIATALIAALVAGGFAAFRPSGK